MMCRLCCGQAAVFALRCLESNADCVQLATLSTRMPMASCECNWTTCLDAKGTMLFAWKKLGTLSWIVRVPIQPVHLPRAPHVTCQDCRGAPQLAGSCLSLSELNQTDGLQLCMPAWGTGRSQPLGRGEKRQKEKSKEGREDTTWKEEKWQTKERQGSHTEKQIKPINHTLEKLHIYVWVIFRDISMLCPFISCNLTDYWPFKRCWLNEWCIFAAHTHLNAQKRIRARFRDRGCVAK